MSGYNVTLAFNGVNTMHRLGRYLACRAQLLSRRCIAHYLRCHHGYWRIHLFERNHFGKEAKKMFAISYPAVLLEFWIYSLGKNMPLATEIKDTQSLFILVADMYKQSLEALPEVRDHIDLRLARDTCYQSLGRINFTSSYEMDLSYTIYQHMQQLLGTAEGHDISVILGHVRLYTVNFMNDWNQTVISESIIRELGAKSADVVRLDI